MKVRTLTPVLPTVASVPQKSAARRTLKRAVGYGVSFGLVRAPAAPAIMVGFESTLIYFRYALHWRLAFLAIGGWTGAMFFSGANGGVAKPR